MKQLQQQNKQNVDLLSAYFQHRSEPNYAWSRACSMYQALPGLRGFWPMSSVDYTAANRGIDLSDQENDLTDNNTVQFGYDSLAPYVAFDGVNQYLSKADGGAGNWADILGTETYIESAVRGLTLGGWFWIDQTTGSNQDLMSKNSGGANRSYFLRYNNANQFAQFSIDNGVLNPTVSSTQTVSFAAWHFIVGRFVPAGAGLGISILLDGVITSLAVGIPASIQDGTAFFSIGSSSVPNNYVDGRASMCFLCASSLSNAIILSLFEQTRAMYNV